MIEVERKTAETDIKMALDMGVPHSAKIDTGLPFFDHMLYSMCFHGRFAFEIKGRGDVEVDPHHLVEDTGLVYGMALAKYRLKTGGIERFAHKTVPMDDALAECVVDAGGRPYFHWDVSWQQERVGNFDLFLLREFFYGLTHSALINLHLCVRYSENAHHAAEALFKAAGLALASAYRSKSGGEASMSTKGKV